MQASLCMQHPMPFTACAQETAPRIVRSNRCCRAARMRDMALVVFFARLLCAIGVSLWSAVVAGSQAVPSAPLSGALRDHVKDERFQIVTSVRGLPLGVRDGLQ